MANYLLGAPQDYIPQVQPFKPDLNFFNYALQTKESQYKAGYNKISSIYGTLLNSPMLRESDITRRDEFFKRAQMEIQKMSEVDLSLNDNVNSAFAVFQPLIDDQNITSDMAKTKRFFNERQRAEGFRNCTDFKKCGGKPWKIGEQALDYWADEYSKTDDTEALSFGDARYVPYNGAQERALEVIKDIAPKVTSVGLGKDGQFIFKTTNGEQVVGPLADMLMGIVGTDPLIQETYQTMAYVDYKNSVKSMAPMYNGNENIAEDIFLGQQISLLDKQVADQMKKLKGTSSVIDARLDILSKDINNGTGKKSDSPLVQAYQDLVAQGQLVNQASGVLQTSADNLDRSTLLTADRRRKRDRILSARANSLLYGDIAKTAYSYGMLTKQTDMEANPYMKSYYDHTLKIQEKQLDHLFDLELETLKGTIKKKGVVSGVDTPVINPDAPWASAKVDPFARSFEQITQLHNQNSANIDKANSELLLRLQNDINNPDPSNPGKVISAKKFLDDIFTPQVMKMINEGRDLSTIPSYQKYRINTYNRAKTLLDNIEPLHNGVKSKFIPSVSTIDEGLLLGNHMSKDIVNRNKEITKQLKAENGRFVDDIPNLFDEYGYPISREAYIKKAGLQYGEKSADNFYTEFVGKWRDLYKAQDDQSAIKLAPGIFALDSYNGLTSQAQNLQAVTRAMDTPAFIGFIPGTKPIDTSEILAKDPKEGLPKEAQWMYDVAKAFEKDFTSEVNPAFKGTREAKGDIVIHPIVMNQYGLSGYSVQPSDSWINKYIGSAKNKGITFDRAKIHEGFTMLFNKAQGPTVFNSFEPSVKKQLLKMGVPVVIKGYEDFGGQVSFNPTQKGTFDMTGYAWNINRETGVPEKTSITSLGLDLSGDIDLQSQVAEQYLQQLREDNIRVYMHAGNPSTQGDIYNVSDLTNQYESVPQPPQE